MYFYDNMDVIGDDGVRFENLVATHLLKRLQLYKDQGGHRYGLHYLRDKEGREVDFAVVKEDKIDALIEAKWSDKSVAPSLLYHQKRLQPRRALQIVRSLERSFDAGEISVQNPGDAFIKTFPLAPIDQNCGTFSPYLRRSSGTGAPPSAPAKSSRRSYSMRRTRPAFTTTSAANL